jgi:nucleoside-diphosphate-sugar epimerase
MRVLVIGGTRFIGPRLVRRLVAAGHEVAVFHRGQSSALLPPAVRNFLGDRNCFADHVEKFRDQQRRRLPGIRSVHPP